jgi:hypothetical protein
MKKEKSLTKKQQAIYNYIQLEGLTVAQIAARLGQSKRNVRKIRKKLLDGGHLSKYQPPTLQKEEVKDIRLHAQKFRIEIIKPLSKRYTTEKLGKSITIDGNNVQCFEKVICVQARGKGFYGADEDEALSDSMEYWYKFFRILENDLNVKILKSRKQNITMTYAEWATENCELSKECEKKDQRIRIYANDGKLRYTTDMSMGYEREAHHHITGKEDSETGNRFIKDVLNNPQAPTFSQLTNTIKQIAEQNKETATGLNTIVEVMKTQLGTIEPRLNDTNIPKYIG